MPTYVIGDIHGCRRTLERLLQELPFDPACDALWTTGDLVNRGNDSVGVLRWAREQSDQLGDRFRTVIGNHDVHLLACAAGSQDPSRRPALRPVLDAPDSAELIDFVRGLPVAVSTRAALLIHAGLLPTWSRATVATRARRVEEGLQSELWPLLVQRGSPSRERADVADDLVVDLQEERQTLAVLTRARCLDQRDDRLHEMVDFSGPPSEAPPHAVPWFTFDGKWRDDSPVVFGHWAALGLHLQDTVMGLDSGCSWGHRLSAVRLEDQRVFQVPVVPRDLERTA